MKGEKCHHERKTTSVDSVNLIFKGVLNRIREANVAEIPALRLNAASDLGHH
jgi:hypothetical protein